MTDKTIRRLPGADPERLSTDDLIAQLASFIGAKRDPREIAHFLSALPRLARPDAGLTGLAGGLRLSGGKPIRVPGAEALLAAYLNSPSEPIEKAAWESARYSSSCRFSSSANASRRARSVRICSWNSAS